ncbi:glycosyltransferase [Verrucomicrobiota bacterium]
MFLDRRVLFLELKKTISKKKVENWDDISSILNNICGHAPDPENLSNPEFRQALQKGIAFITYDFGIDGVSIEINKYAECMGKILKDNKDTIPPMHFIGGDFHDNADAVLKPEWNRFKIKEMNGWSKWYNGKYFSRLYYEDMPENSTASHEMSVEIWKQTVRLALELGAYLAENEISLLVPVNIICNPGNLAITLATALVTEAMGIYALNSNHDFYWEGGKPASERKPGEEPGVRDHFFRNMKNKPFFSLFQRLYPWNGKLWTQVNINTQQSKTLAEDFGFEASRLFALSTSISDEFFRNYDEKEVQHSRLRMAHILSDGKSTIKTMPISEHMNNLGNWIKNQKPLVCSFPNNTVLDTTNPKTIYCLQPTRVIARKRIEKNLHLFSALMNYEGFRREFESDPERTLVLHITGPVPIEHQEDLEVILNAYIELCEKLPSDLANRIFVAFSVGTETHPCFKRNNFARMHIEDIYRMATIILFPSETEGRGLPIIEASSCGVPIVCSRYYPEDVFKEVTGENLTEEKQIKYILFPEKEFSEDMLEEVTGIMLHRENEQKRIEHNKNAVRLRYSTETLKAVFEPVLETLRQS